MIHLSFALSNPRGKPFANLWNRSGLITKNKAWEAEILQSRQIIGFQFGYTVRQSHAGLDLELGVFGYSISFQIYDTRHWNHITNNWDIYGESN